MNTDQSGTSGIIGKTKAVLLKIFTGPKWKRNVAIIILFIAAFGFIYYKYLLPATPTTYEYATVARKDIKKSVEGSGKVVSVSELDIQQLSGGKVTAVLVKPGDYVKEGQIIARLDSRQAAISLAQAKASYDKIINGSTKEELDITNQSVINAKQSYNITKQQQDTSVANAKKTLLNSGLAVTSLYDDKLYSDAPTLSGSYTCTEEVEYKISVNSSTYANVTGGDASGQILITSVPQALGSCGLYLSFDSSKSWGIGEWKVSIPNKLSSTYSSNLNAYNNALVSREQALLNASTSIVNAELSLNQKVVGARPEDRASAEASYASAQLSYENTIIRAPFDGQIGSVSAAVGQQTSTQTGVATIITKDKIAEISLNEIDIVNVKLGQEVELSFDAIPDETFTGRVAEINTVGVAASNVVSFAVKISIPNADERIRSGMSVTANIIVEKKEDALTVPSATIKTEGSGENMKSYVLKSGARAPAMDASSTASTTPRNLRRATSIGASGPNTKTYVVVGLNNDTDAEILDGLSEGDMVVSKTVAGSATAKTTSTFSLFGSGPRGGATGGTTVRAQGGNATFTR
jgi:HlyD family secretion protein